MAGGYDGSLRFNTKIDEAGFLRSIDDLQSAVGMLERALDRMASAMHGDMNAAAESAEQAADSVKAAARKVDAIPDTVSVAVNVQADGISETVSALDSIAGPATRKALGI